MTVSAKRQALLERVIRDTILLYGVAGVSKVCDALKPLIEEKIAAEAEKHGDESDLHAALEGALGAVEQLAAECEIAAELE